MKKLAATISGCCLSLISLATPGVTMDAQPKSIAFTENKGQIIDQFGHPRPDIDFKVEGQGVNIFVGDGQMHYQWNKMTNRTLGSPLQLLKSGKQLDITTETYRMDVTLIGANKNAVGIATEEQGYEERYYTSVLNDGVVHTYKKITYRDVYPHIDWVLYTASDAKGNGGVKYDFVVRPGGDPSNIKLKYAGASLAVKADGSLVATTPMGEIQEQAPYSYTITDGNKTTVASRYILKGNDLSFSTASYNGTLVIDPVIQWATYYAGTGLFELCSGLASDAAANVYMAGVTNSSTNVASTGAHQATFGGNLFDGYLVKLDANGIRKWATYYGGTGNEIVMGVACDKWANLYLSGNSGSNTNIATANGYTPAKTGSGTAMFLARFDSTGVRKWGTYYGTTGQDIGVCAVDNKGGIFLAGYTTGTVATLVSSGAFQTTNRGRGDALLVKFDTACNREWATFFGGDSLETVSGIAADMAGNVFINGSTKSRTNITTNGSYQSVFGGNTDQYLAKFDGTGNRVWGTYFGGPGEDLEGETNTISTDSKGNVFFSGRTSSRSGIASPNAAQTAYGGGTFDAFLVKFDSVGVRQWATYIGDTSYEMGSAVVANADGETLMSGYTQSHANIATPGSVQPNHAGGTDDAFLIRFNANGQRLWSTYYGGPGDDYGIGVAFAQEQGSVFIAGTTSSATGIATTGSHQPALGIGGISSFIAKFCIAALPASYAVTGDASICINSTHTYTIPATPGSTYIWTLPIGWTGSSTTNTITATANTSSGTVRVRMVLCNDTSAQRTLTVNMHPWIPAVITGNGTQLSTTNTFTGYQWFYNGQPITGATNATYTVTRDGNYRVAGISAQGCVDTSDVFTITFLSVNNVPASSMSIYPNPAKNVVNIQSAAPVMVAVYSMDGKQIIPLSSQKSLNVSTLPAGVYVVRITAMDGSLLKTERLVRLAD